MKCGLSMSKIYPHEFYALMVNTYPVFFAKRVKWIHTRYVEERRMTAMI